VVANVVERTNNSRTILIILLVCVLTFLLSYFFYESSEQAYERGMAYQKERDTERAIRAYKKAILLNPRNALAHYELGWSYWVQERWPDVVTHWQKAKALNLKNPLLSDYLNQAINYAAGKYKKLKRVPIGTYARSKNGSLTIELIARYQRYNPKPVAETDFYDETIRSPKSVQFHPSNNKVYVNALEAEKTLIFSPLDLRKTNQIEHDFDESNAYLFSQPKKKTAWPTFPKSIRQPNIFSGKPVEQTFSPDGKLLWVPYYRRSFDRYSRYPSALALIDVASEKIIRVFDTGPIPKYVTASPDGKWLAVTHWGDNTVGLIKTIGKPENYKRDRIFVVEKKMNLNDIKSTDRDHGCGFCLRGAVFSKDSRYLFVARMGGGGIAIIDIKQSKYLGSVFGMPPTPRHLLLSNDGKQLFLSSNHNGSVSKYNTVDLIQAVKQGQKELEPLAKTTTGPLTRTISLSPDGEVIFAAVNKESKIVALDAETLHILLEIDADSYPVGMDISPDGSQLWVTAQGRRGRGGNSVMVYRVDHQSHRIRRDQVAVQ